MDGQLFVLVIEGRNIVPKDWGGSSDPYVKVYLDKVKQFKTRFILKSLEPRWNEQAHQLPLSADKPAGVIKFSVWDYDRFKWDEFLGEVLIPVEELYDGVPRDEWYPLQSRKGKSDKVTGDLHLQILFLEPGDQMTPTYDEFPYPLQTLMVKKKIPQFKNAVEKGKLLEVTDKKGLRPLHAACREQMPECVTALLNKGADINGADANTAALPIHAAAQWCAEAIPLLLAKGAEVEAKDATERRPLHYAAIGNNPQAVSVLVSKGANINAQDKDGQTALHRALLEKESWAAIRALVENGADIYIADKQGKDCPKLCTDEKSDVSERTKKEFMTVLGIKDDREFELRRNFPKKYYVEGRNLSFEWKQNCQFAVCPAEGTTKINVLMHYVYAHKTAKQMEKTCFIVVTSDEGTHKEPSYQQDLLGYGTFAPFVIDVTARKPKEKYYVLMPFAKSTDVSGYYDMILYSDGDLEVRELVEWKHTVSTNGAWTEDLSGGDQSCETWLNNPQFLLKIPNSDQLPDRNVTMSIMLAQAKAALDLLPYQVLPYQFYIGYYILEAGHVEEVITQCETWKNAQETYVHFSVDTTKHEEFVIVPATHFPGQLTTFTLTVFSDVPVEIAQRN